MLTEPATLRAGDSVSWSRDLPEYPALDGWTLKYRILFGAAAAISFSAVAGAGTSWTVTLTATVTGAFTAGAATRVAYVERGSGATLERVTLETAPIQILPNLSALSNLDDRSAAARALADLKAALAAHAGRVHVAEYEIAGRRTKFRTPAEIIVQIRYYEQEVARERRAAALAAGGAGTRVLVRG